MVSCLDAERNTVMVSCLDAERHKVMESCLEMERHTVMVHSVLCLESQSDAILSYKNFPLHI